MASVVSSIRVAGLWNFRVAVASTRQRIKRLGNVCSALKTISDLTGFALLQLGSAMNVVHPAQSSIDGAARRDGRIFGSGRCAGGMAGRGSKIGAGCQTLPAVPSRIHTLLACTHIARPNRQQMLSHQSLSRAES